MTNNIFHAYATFIVWPVLSLVYAIVNWRSKWSKNIIWLFCGFYGYTFTISSEGFDASRYRDSLVHLHNSDISFGEYFRKVSDGEYGRGDYLEPLIRYLVSIFTDNYHVLFLIFGLVMGFFYSRNIWTLLEIVGRRLKHHGFPVLMMFVFLVPIWLINGFRFWTATHIFLYGVFQLFNYRNYLAGILMFVLSVFTHVAFLLPVSVLAVFHLIPERNWFFVGFILSSLLLVNFDLGFFLNLIPQKLNNPIVELARGYLQEEYVSKRLGETEKLHWYIRYRSLPLYLYTIFISIYLLLLGKIHLVSRNVQRLLYFGILMFGITNIINIIPSVGRFYSVSFFAILAALFFIIQKYKTSRFLQHIFWSAAIFVLLPLVVEFRIGLIFISLETLVYNPLVAWIMNI